MAFTLWLLLLPLGSAAHRGVTDGSGASNGTEGGEGRLEAGLCGECDTYEMSACVLCPNCKWRGGKCMHSCTACCAYTDGCNAEYCVCDGKTNAFKGRWKACGLQGETKYYQFQMRVPREAGDRSKDMLIAVQLLRSAEDPQLILLYNQEWTVKVRREEDTTIGYVPVPASPGADTRKEVIHLADAEYIRVFKAQLGEVAVTALEIKAPDSDEPPFTIYGGLYVPDSALQHAVDIFWPQHTRPPYDDGSGMYVAEPVFSNKPGRKPVEIAHVRVSKLIEPLASGKTGAATDAAMAGAVGALTGGAAAHAAFAGSYLTLPAVLLGSAAGRLVGTALAAHLGDATREETSLLASEKIFEKMRCHRLFQRCSGAAIAPAHGGGRCPPVGGQAAE